MTTTIIIGRTSGPSTDMDITMDQITPAEIEVIKDVLAAVNAVANDKEGWYVRFEDGSAIQPFFGKTAERVEK